MVTTTPRATAKYLGHGHCECPMKVDVRFRILKDKKQARRAANGIPDAGPARRAIKTAPVALQPI